MEINVWTTFRGHLAQNRFSVSCSHGEDRRTYPCTYEAGQWSFSMYDQDRLVLESRPKPFVKKGFWNHQEYDLLWEGQAIGLMKKSFCGKVLVADRKALSFPGLFRPEVPELGLRFPLRSLLWRVRVRSFCQAAVNFKKVVVCSLCELYAY